MVCHSLTASRMYSLANNATESEDRKIKADIEPLTKYIINNTHCLLVMMTNMAGNKQNKCK